MESSAIQADVDYIVTRDIDDFVDSRVKAVTPEQYLALLE
uniref:Uncharacterized protein n=1 Tax=uncultured bacterium contig00070 TaxID=1181551 RepID=A0A806KK22_9BACT|nr:hypothetical protein [uncultured bacterium contig00070]